MTSLRGRIVHWTFRHRQLFAFRLTQEERDWSDIDIIHQFREECEEGARRFGRLPKGLEIQNECIGNIRAEWIRPSRPYPQSVILFVHGGGYVSGSCSDHRIHAAKFVNASGIPALLYDYRLAPEHPYPAALDDSIAVYNWLFLQGYSSQNICLLGDSAGGGLCLALLLALRDRGIPLPQAAVAISPWTDLCCSGESYRSNAKKCLSPKGTWQEFSCHYVGETNPNIPYISPLYGELTGLPPLYITTGEDEILRDDAVSFTDKARSAGVSVTLEIGPGLFHCYPVCAPLFPEANAAMENITRFIRLHLSR